MTDRANRTWRAVVAAVAALALAGCSRQEKRMPYRTGNPEHDELVAGAISNMMRPAEAAAGGWPLEGEPEASLAQLAEHIRQLFDRYEEIDKLIFPQGWVRRKLEPVAVEPRLIRSADGSPGGVIRLTYQKKSSVIHETRGQAAADNDLLPYASAQSREQMTAAPHRPWPPVTLTITYQLETQGGTTRWRRTNWSAKPEIVEGSGFLDRIGVP
jgi:hypothetical protein